MVKYDDNNNIESVYVEINSARKERRTEKEERERLKYWSQYWAKKTKVKASSCVW